MEIKELLGLAREYAASVRENFPDFSEQKQATVTLILTARNAIVAGVTGIGFEDGKAVVVDSVSQAVTALSGSQIAVGLVTGPTSTSMPPGNRLSRASAGWSPPMRVMPRARLPYLKMRRNRLLS